MRFLRIAVLVVAFANSIAVLAGSNCNLIEWLHVDSIPISRSLDRPGTYCLSSDVRQRKVHRVIDRRAPRVLGLTFVAISASNIRVELRSHRIQSDLPGRVGITSVGIYGRAVDAYSVWVSNGKLLLGSKSIGISLPREALPQSLLSDSPNEITENRDLEFSDSERLAPKWKLSHLRASEYVDGNYSIDNMDIRAGELGIKLFGRGNRITNSRIEVTDSRAGIYIFGPDNVIENNILVFRGIAQTNSAAPIKLHHGDGTVIRNNLIIVEGMTGRQAVSLIETQGIELSGNRVYGAAEFVRLYAGSDGLNLSANVLGDARDGPVIDDEVRRADAVPGAVRPRRLPGPR